MHTLVAIDLSELGPLAETLLADCVAFPKGHRISNYTVKKREIVHNCIVGNECLPENAPQEGDLVTDNGKSIGVLLGEKFVRPFTQPRNSAPTTPQEPSDVKLTRTHCRVPTHTALFILQHPLMRQVVQNIFQDPECRGSLFKMTKPRLLCTGENAGALRAKVSLDVDLTRGDQDVQTMWRLVAAMPIGVKSDVRWAKAEHGKHIFAWSDEGHLWTI